MRKDVQRFRRFNRFYTRLLGLLGRPFLDSPLSLGQARLLFEINATPDCLAVELGKRLDMDKSQLSRMLAALTDKTLIQKTVLREDRRGSTLRLTTTGKKLLDELEATSDTQAAAILKKLPAPARRSTLAAMTTLERALDTDRPPNRPVLRDPKPGDMGYLLESHGRIYAAEYGFDTSFEGYVLLGLEEFHKSPPDRRKMIIATQDGRPVGGIAVMPRKDNLAQLRWFIVEQECRGLGTGRKLLDAAIAHSRKQDFAGLYLWTLDMLDAARGLYQKAGFKLVETRSGPMGGLKLNEERWVLSL